MEPRPEGNKMSYFKKGAGTMCSWILPKSVLYCSHYNNGNKFMLFHESVLHNLYPVVFITQGKSPHVLLPALFEITKSFIPSNAV